MSDYTHLPEEFEDTILEAEFSEKGLKPNAQARIVWQDVQQKQKTEYALVYLHGFSANHLEGYPVHLNIAESFRMNLYLSRLCKHGKSSRSFRHLHAEGLIKSAEGALDIGQQIGEKVILMGTSTGASLSLYLAAKYRSVAALVLYSPLIDFYEYKARVLKNSLVNITLQKLAGKRFWLNKRDDIDPMERIWHAAYPIEGLLQLARFVKNEMTEKTFSRIHQPVFAGYYHKNSDEEDKVVSVRAIRRMLRTISTSKDLITDHPFENAGSHVICSPLTSQAVEEVFNATRLFIARIISA